MSDFEFPQSKVCYLYDPVTRIYLGTDYGYLLPPYDKEEYYAPPNSVYVKPRGTPQRGYTYQLNAKGTGWLAVEDWSAIPLYFKATSLRAPSPAPGAPLPADVTDAVPPEGTATTWPRWDSDNSMWIDGLNNAGKLWFNDKGEDGALVYAWDELPKGAQFGMAPAKRKARMRVIQKELMAEARELIELCEELLNQPGATTGDSEQLKAVKAWRSAILVIDLDSDPTTFVEPERPNVTVHSGEPLG